MGRGRALQFAAMLLALATALVFEHTVVHHHMIAPVLAAGLPVPPWAWATLFIPELVACFLSGWRIRGWRELAVYTAGATALRAFTTFALGWPGATRSDPDGSSPRSDTAAGVAARAVVFGVAYLLTFALARSSARTPGPDPARHGSG